MVIYFVLFLKSDHCYIFMSNDSAEGSEKVNLEKSYDKHQCNRKLQKSVIATNKT